MYKKNKSIKHQLNHLNECYAVFENYANNQNISNENKPEFIKLMLQNYINSSEVITSEQIQEIKDLNASYSNKSK